MKKIDWKSKKTIIIIVVAVVLVLALLSVGIITFGNYREAAEVQDLKEKIAAFPDVDDLTAEDSDALSELIEAYNALSDEEKSELAEESAKLQNASNKIEQITGTKPDVTMPAEESTSSAATTAPSGSTSSTTKPSGNTSSNSGMSSKPSGGSSSGSSGSNTTSKPSGGSSSGSNTTSKPSTGGSTSKPETTTSKPTTTQPAKKEFAMTKQEIIDYASDYIEDTYGCTYYDGFGKDVPGTGYIPPSVFVKGDSEEYIKARLRGCADATYGPNGWYKVYIEQVNEDTIKVYLFY